MPQATSRDRIYYRRRYTPEVIELCVRWYLTYRLSYRNLSAMMAERGIAVSHTSIMRWVQRYVPEFERRWARFSKPPNSSWRIHLARGIYFKKVGQARRGNDFINKTSAAQLMGMGSAYKKAEQDFHAGAALSEKPLLTYMHAMDISTSYGRGAENRQLLDLSLRIDPGNFVVRQKYMLSLEPRWGGSVHAMRAFPEECRRANLPAAQLRNLEAVIVADQAGTDYDFGRYAAAASEFRQAIQMGGEIPCLACAAYAMAAEKQYADAVKVYSIILDANPGDLDALSRLDHI